MDVVRRVEVSGPPARVDEDRPFRWAATDQLVALTWLASRVSVFIAATYATWTLAGSPDTAFGSDPEAVPDLGPIATWNRWDLSWYVSIARDGYGAPGFESSYAFMPAFPAVLHAFAAVGVHPTLAGLAVSLAAGFVAALALARLTAMVGGRGEMGVLAWVLAPAAVYLAAPYPEALFCAAAFSAWLFARRGAWLRAGLLASAACLVRVNGLFLACALVVLFLTQRPRAWRRAAPLLLPFASIAAVLTYYRSVTGSWSTWLDAQSIGWHREFTNPWDTFTATVDYAFNIGLTATFNIQYKLELAFMLAVLILAVVMLAHRWWGEATYVLLTVTALASSTVYYSVPRATLVLFPVWMLLGVWLSRRRWVLATYVAVCAPLMLVGVVTFVNGRWVA